MNTNPELFSELKGPRMRALTEQQRTFVYALCVGGSVKVAAEESGISEEIATSLVGRQNIRLAINECACRHMATVFRVFQKYQIIDMEEEAAA